MLIIVSGVAVDLLMDTLATLILGVRGVDAMVDVNLKVFAVLMTAFEFIIPCPLEGFRW